VIHTHYPTELLGVVSFYGNGVLPKNLGGKSAKAFFDQPVGTGPFRMASWNLGQQMTLRRNDYYWRPGKPYLDEVDLTVVASDNTRMLQLRGSQADIVEAPPWAQLSSLKDEGGLSIQLFPSTIVDFLSLNERYKPLNDPLVRTAMSQAIDRQAIVKVALFGYGQAAGSVFAPSWPAYDASLTAPVRDLAAARATLARSSFTKSFSVTHSIDGGDTVQSTVAQLIQNNLADIGIKVKIQQYDSNTLETLVGDHEFELYHDLLSLDVMDPVENVPSLVDPSTGGDGEWAGFHDKQVLAWCNEAQHTTDAAVQTAAYQNIQRRIRELNQFIPLYYVPYAYATSTRLQGLVVPPTGDYRLEEAWLAT
ncbi:MAG: ABC transporter substrate-binding protein, partial [Actinobacteria bacterium]|nr:ABC transporter substrate-binding protein [Actinomycetota bacterium]